MDIPHPRRPVLAGRHYSLFVGSPVRVPDAAGMNKRKRCGQDQVSLEERKVEAFRCDTMRRVLAKDTRQLREGGRKLIGSQKILCSLKFEQTQRFLRPL